MHSLIKSVFKSGLGVIANLTLGLVAVKVMAVILGPSGTGLFSLIRQSVVTLSSLAAGGQTALVQGIASKDEQDKVTYIRSTFWMYLAGCLLCIFIIEFFAKTITSFIFSTATTENVMTIRLLALPVALTFIFVFLKSVLNGHRAIGLLAIIESIGALTTAILAYPTSMAVKDGYTLAFIWMLCGALMPMIGISSFFIHKNGWIKDLLPKTIKLINISDCKYFIKITGITFITALMSAATILYVRSTIAKESGLQQAGLFDLAWTLSGSYVMLILASLGTFYTPTLAQAKTDIERVKLIQRILFLSTFLMTPMIVSVIVFKPIVVTSLYSNQYIDSLDLVRWMLIGDYLKITSWILAIPAIVNSHMKIYFWTETFWNIGFAALSTLSIVYFHNLQGIGLAFIALYFALLVCNKRYLHKIFNHDITKDFILKWLIGFSLVVIASIVNWSNLHINLFQSISLIFASCVYSLVILGENNRSVISEKIRNVIKL